MGRGKEFLCFKKKCLIFVKNFFLIKNNFVQETVFKFEVHFVSSFSRKNLTLLIKEKLSECPHLAVCICLFLATDNTTKIFPVDPKTIKKK